MDVPHINMYKPADLSAHFSLPQEELNLIQATSLCHYGSQKSQQAESTQVMYSHTFFYSHTEPKMQRHESKGPRALAETKLILRGWNSGGTTTGRSK